MRGQDSMNVRRELWPLDASSWLVEEIRKGGRENMVDGFLLIYKKEIKRLQALF